MNRRAYVQMMASVWITALLFGILHATSTFPTSFCSNIVNQFFWELPQLLKLYCSKEYQTEMLVVLLSVLTVFGCFIFVIITYIQICKVLRIPSVQGKRKAFSTCLPHLIVFSTFVFTTITAHLRPSFDTSYNTIMYSTLPPMLNPFIYSMRNKDIKVALSKLFLLNQADQMT